MAPDLADPRRQEDPRLELARLGEDDGADVARGPLGEDGEPLFPRAAAGAEDAGTARGGAGISEFEAETRGELTGGVRLILGDADLLQEDDVGVEPGELRAASARRSVSGACVPQRFSDEAQLLAPVGAARVAGLGDRDRLEDLELRLDPLQSQCARISEVGFSSPDLVQ